MTRLRRSALRSVLTAVPLWSPLWCQLWCPPPLFARAPERPGEARSERGARAAVPAVAPGREAPAASAPAAVRVKAGTTAHRTSPAFGPAPAPPASTTAGPESVDAIDPLIGSGGLGWGVGSAVPGATVPFGMVKISPDTATNGVAPGFSHCAGYWYADTSITGFTHNHLSGTGVPDQGNVRVMPLVGMDDRQSTPDGYASPFSHEGEQASAGYYAVTLDNGGIRAELTAAMHTAFHRYTFPATNLATLLIDVTGTLEGGTASDVDFEILPGQQEVVGTMNNHGSLSGRYGGQPIFFSAYFRTPFRDFGVFADGRVYPDETSTTGDQVGAWAQFTTSQGQVLELEVGISYVSIENARLNRETETDGRTFEEVRAEARDAWAEKTALIDLEGGTDVQRRTFYTALYHSMMMPTYYTDVNGQYLGFDKQVHQAVGFDYYTDMSTWDTFRTTHPLMTLIEPEIEGDFVTSMLAMYDQLGHIDRWPQGNGATGCMIGDSPAIVIADSYLKGVRNFDVQKAYQSVRTMATLEGPAWHREDLSTILSLGYIPVENGGKSASSTLEYAYDDGALANFASALGKTDDAAMFAARSLFYRNIFNPETGFLQGRHADGTFVTPFYSHYSAEYYAEGSAWQWTWYAPHDVAGLIDLFGGKRKFEQQLDKFFSSSARNPDTLFPDLNYWQGNEPDIHAPYLYHYVGAPQKSAQWARWVLETKFDDSPSGLDGNDDGGTMSSWYVFSALGLYPVPGSDVYLIGSPLFSKATLHLAGGTLAIVAPGSSEANLYVQQASLNGKPLDRAWLRHSEIAGGGVLELDMGSAPSDWATTGPLPPSISTGN